MPSHHPSFLPLPTPSPLQPFYSVVAGTVFPRLRGRISGANIKDKKTLAVARKRRAAADEKFFVNLSDCDELPATVAISEMGLKNFPRRSNRTPSFNDQCNEQSLNKLSNRAKRREPMYTLWKLSKRVDVYARDVVCLHARSSRKVYVEVSSGPSFRVKDLKAVRPMKFRTRGKLDTSASFVDAGRVQLFSCKRRFEPAPLTLKRLLSTVRTAIKKCLSPGHKWGELRR